jgi:hypothetical protein
VARRREGEGRAVRGLRARAGRALGEVVADRGTPRGARRLAEGRVLRWLVVAEG